MRKRNFLLTAILAAGAATFLLGLLRRRHDEIPLLYVHPKGGEREGGFELFIGS